MKRRRGRQWRCARHGWLPAQAGTLFLMGGSGWSGERSAAASRRHTSHAVASGICCISTAAAHHHWCFTAELMPLAAILGCSACGPRSRQRLSGARACWCAGLRWAAASAASDVPACGAVQFCRGGGGLEGGVHCAGVVGCFSLLRTPPAHTPHPLHTQHAPA